MALRTGRRERSVLPPLALTMGDPAGIGLDITLPAYDAVRRDASAAFFLIADPAAVSARAASLGSTTKIVAIAAPSEAAAAFASGLPVLPVRLAAPVTPGRPDKANAPAIVACIERAVAACFAGEASSVVTNPIAKAVLYEAGFAHPGHTEFLGELARRHDPRWAGSPMMMLAADELRVVPLTIHIPLASVPGAITREALLSCAAALHTALRLDFGIASPRIAVAGLNPHAGEGGSIGREEVEIIAPAIAELQSRRLAVSGPHSADTLFHAAARERYDAVIAMYHDQALIPLKTLAFDRGVNVTLGLPFVRTSPDHGTAFDIAGTGRASPASLVAALHMAAGIAERRAAGAVR